MAFFFRWLEQWSPGIRGSRRERAQRRPEPEEPPAMAGVGAPLLPRTPQLAGGNARRWPPEEE